MQIYCNASAEVLFERFHKRAISGERHPGHVDHIGTYDDYLTVLQGGKYGMLDIGGYLVELDTADANWLDQALVQETTRMIQAQLKQ